MAEVPNIFHSPLPAGKITVDSQVTLGQSPRTHTALTLGISAAQINVLDSADISEGAHMAQEIANTNAQLTGSSHGPAGIPAPYSIINGIAIIRQSEQHLATGR